MSKNVTNVILTASFLALGLGNPGWVKAQTLEQQVYPDLLKMTPQQRQKAIQDFKNNYPLLAKRKLLSGNESLLPNANRPSVQKEDAKSTFMLPLLASAKAENLWANVVSLDSWGSNKPYGYYSFPTSGEISFTKLGTQYSPIALNGVQVEDGYLYGSYLNTSYAAYGVIMQYLSKVNLTDWSFSSDLIENRYDLVALETAQAEDGTVYGQFYNSDLSGLEWGTVDYIQQTRTNIGKSTHTYVALGVTSDNQLYGVATDGNLYKVSTSTGAETLVGATGLTVADTDGSYYTQTGEIDPSDNTFYWAAVDANGNSGLYTVDLATGAATAVGSFSGNLAGMVVPHEATADDVPAKASRFFVVFNEGALTGGFAQIALPTKTKGGEDLSSDEDLTYVITANGQQIATGTGKPGDTKMAFGLTIPKSGSYIFTAYSKNSKGMSPVSKQTGWCGYDVPSAPTNVSVTLTDKKNATISWEAPTQGVHQGHLGTLTYDVYRVNKSENTTTLCQEGVSDCTAQDVIPDGNQANYAYQVVAKNEEFESASTESNTILAGDAIEPDWSNNFATSADFDLFTVYDENNDNVTWTYDSYNHYAKTGSTVNKGNDDWLVSPGIHLEANREYTLSVKAMNAGSHYVNTLEIKYGKGDAPADMTTTLQETTTPSNEWNVYTYTFSVAEDGSYYFGLHDNTEMSDQLTLYVDSFAIKKGASFNAPDAVDTLIVTPGSKGQLSATLDFRLPTKNLLGQALSSISKVEIYRDGELLSRLGTQTPGGYGSYTDNDFTASGSHTYEVVCYSNDLKGRTKAKTVYVGKDIPSMPKNTKLCDNETNVIAKWDAFTEEGSNGGYVDPSDVSVGIYRYTVNSYGETTLGENLGTSNPGETQVAINLDPEKTTAYDGVSQRLLYLAAQASNSIGTSAYTSTGTIVVGKPKSLPYFESVSKGKLDNFMYVESNDAVNSRDNSTTWFMSKDMSADQDGGCLLWAPNVSYNTFGEQQFTIEEGDESSICSPKLSLQGASHPVLSFCYYAKVNESARLVVIAQKPDGTKVELKNLDLALTTNEGWATESVDLSNLSSERYVIVKFKGVSEGDDTYMGLDNINLYDQLSDNLKATSISVPNSCVAGKSCNVVVGVQNLGANKASDYEVVVYVNDKAQASTTVADELGSLESTQVTVTLPVKPNAEGTLNVKAEVVYDNDLDLTNNTTATKQIEVSASQYNKVNDLKAETDGTDVTLSWSKPAPADYKVVTEDFEGYDAFATELGDWKLVDADNGYAGQFFSDYTYPVQNQKFAFTAFNASKMVDEFDALESNPGLGAHSGNQFAGAPYQIDAAGYSYVESNNWLISPQLSGKAQTISFYAYNVNGYPETFDVLASSTNNETTSFEVVSSETADGTVALSTGPNWKQISVDLPEGTKYFAIHQYTSDSFLFGIDDITFEQGVDGVNEKVTGYNIYRDGELVGHIDGDHTTFTDTDVEGDKDYVYNITVVYEDAEGNSSESGFSNDATINVTSIEAIEAQGATSYNVYTLDGKTVLLNAKSIKGLKKGAYIINDKKYIIK